MNTPAAPAVCRHCKEGRPCRPRGLCWPCYYDPAIRESYASKVRRGVEDFEGPAALPPVPTRALPGTREKVDIMVERARLGQALWHPHDRVRQEGDAAPLYLREAHHDGPKVGLLPVRVLLDRRPRRHLETPLDPVED